MLVLYYPGVGHFTAGVVYDGVALVVVRVQHFGLEVYLAVFKVSEAVAEVCVYGPGVYDTVCLGEPALLAFVEVHARAHFNAFQHLPDYGGVAPLRDALVTVIEVVVVKGEAHRKALDYEGRKLGAVPSPLLLRVSLHELFVKGAAHEVYGLLLKVLGAGRVAAADLLLYARLGLRWSEDVRPHLREGVHVERHVVALVPVTGHGGVYVVVEGREAVYVIPYLLVRGVEYVRPVLVHIDPLYALRVYVASYVLPLLQHKALVSLLLQLICAHGAIQPASCYYVIIFGHFHFLRSKT